MTPTATVAVAPPTTTAAATTDPATRVMAREFATRGAEAFDRGAYAEALDDFNRAAALFGAPTIALMQARALVKLGRWLEGLDHYQSTARQSLDASDPAPFHDAVRQAAAEGEALRQQLPRLSLLVDTQAQPPIVVELDGQTLPALLLNTQRPIDPGTHKLRASKGGVPFLERTFETPPGQHTEIPVIPPAPKPATVARPTTVDAPSAQTSSQVPTPNEEPPNWPLIGVATIGGLGAVGVGLTTIIGSAADARLEDECGASKICTAEQRGDIDTLDTARTLFYISSAMFVIGGSLTTYLLLTEEGGDGAQAKLSFSPFGAQLTTLF